MRVKYVGKLAVKVQEGQKIQYGDEIEVNDKTAESLISGGRFEKVEPKIVELEEVKVKKSKKK